MLSLTDKQIADYFKRSYMAVDGLWFVKIEERFGFDTALEFDDIVWQIMPKIQARKLKSLVPMKEGLAGLLDGFTTKMTLEGYTYDTRRTDDGFEISVTQCPWYDIMVGANRRHIAEKIGSRICTSEAKGWAAEFDKNISFELTGQLCQGKDCCRLCFKHNNSQCPRG